ncbi:MAG: DNA integrity scanning protein DisA nucleotide-binding domain protein [Patescibacteria group bacterium]
MAKVSFIDIANSIPAAFYTFTWSSAFDIVIAAFFIYVLLVFIKQTQSYFIFNTIAVLLVVSYFAQLFNLSLTIRLFQPILTFFLVIFVIVFQREIRRFFRWFTLSRQTLSRTAANLSSEISGIIVHAVQDMAKLKMGALIVLSGDYPLDDTIEGGFALDGKISSPLILSIFDHTTPGHDGAMIIEGKRIKRFGVHLPLAEDFKGFATMGTRHRAAIGISERTDSLAVVVSEERGTISVSEGGKIRLLQNAGELDDVIKKFLKENGEDDMDTPNIWKYMLLHNFYLKVIAIGAAIILWFALVV